MALLHALAAATLLLFTTPAALAVYKCTGDGGTTYSQMPCEGGSKVKIDNAVTGAGSADLVEQEKKELRRLEREEKKGRTVSKKERQRAARAQASLKKKCTALELREKWAREDATSASIRASSRARLRALRAGEEYERVCAPLRTRQMDISN